MADYFENIDSYELTIQLGATSQPRFMNLYTTLPDATPEQASTKRRIVFTGHVVEGTVSGFIDNSMLVLPRDDFDDVYKLLRNESDAVILLMDDNDDGNVNRVRIYGGRQRVGG